MDLGTLNDDDRYRVAHYPGVAFWYAGPQIELYDDGGDEPAERQTGMALMVMVGDDRRHVVDPEDVSPLAEEDYCHSCGQVGCPW
jgi:hypothetical protein